MSARIVIALMEMFCLELGGRSSMRRNWNYWSCKCCKMKLVRKIERFSGEGGLKGEREGIYSIGNVGLT